MCACPDVAFLVAFHQNGALLGRNGLLPADLYLDEIEQRIGGADQWMSKFTAAPTLLWLCARNDVEVVWFVCA
jgi:hypothetical protein